MRIELPILSFVVLPLLLLPLPAHIKAGNIALVTLAVTLFIVNLTRGINSIVWANTVVVKWEIWCDITTKFIIGAQVAIPAAALCITRHLERVASVHATIQTASDKRRRQIFEICMCIVFPCIIMALHYVVQGHRFDLGEDFGCAPNVYYSIPGILIIWVPPFALNAASMIYATAAFCWFVKRRAQFAEHLQRGGSGLSTGRYTRLMGMAVTEILISNGYGTYVLVFAQRASPLRIWDNWAHVHSHFSRVAQFPRALAPEAYWLNIEMTWFAVTLGSFAFFLFFAFGEEAIAEYKRWYFWVRKNIFRRKPIAPVLPTVSLPPRLPVLRTNPIDRLSFDEKWNDHQMELSFDTASHSSLKTVQTTTPPLAPESPASIVIDERFGPLQSSHAAYHAT